MPLMRGWVSKMRTVIKALILAIVGALLLVGSVYAHAAYLRSIPGADAVVAMPPERVDIWFQSELFKRKGENTILVISPDGKSVASDDTNVDDDDRTHIWVTLQPDLPAGEYRVAWKNVALEDGHPSEGEFTFTIDPQAKETSTPMGESTPTSVKPVPSNRAGIAAQVSPTTEVPVKSPPSAAQPCAAASLPLIGLVALVIFRRSCPK